jgi:hypothetical protein
MKEKLTPYYIATSFDEEIYNAGIVRYHQEKIMDVMGFKSFRFNYSSKKGILSKCLRIQQCISIAFSIPQKSIVYFHFPFQATIDMLLLWCVQLRGIKTAALIIDIDGLRDLNEQLLKKEMAQLSKFNYLVAHNEEMEKWLLLQLPSATIFNISVFDYSYAGKVTPKQLSPVICFAGNISKATFVYNWHQSSSLHLNVYGLGYDVPLNIKNGVTYKGIAPPDQLPFVIEGSFGLVWDGNDLNNCDPYLMYNNPHKLSLYLAAGMPVIVWNKSAVAAWVLEKNIGFCIGSILEIGNFFDNISCNEYEIMKKNAAAIGKQLCDGYYLKTVLKNIENGGDY